MEVGSLPRRIEEPVRRRQEHASNLSIRAEDVRAELDANVDPELMAANDIKIRQLSLEEAKRRLEQ